VRKAKKYSTPKRSAEYATLVDEQTFEGARILQDIYERGNPLLRIAKGLGASGPSRPLPPGVKQSEIVADEESAPTKRRRRQRERAEKAIDKLYPKGTDLPTETVRAAVAGELGAESKASGLANPSWDVVNRVLGRGRK
jgi:hypothetical protein